MSIAASPAPVTAAPSPRSNSLSSLTPSQQQAFDQAKLLIPAAPLTLIHGDIGVGKSLIVRHLQSQLGGHVYDLGDVLATASENSASNMESALANFIESVAKEGEIVFLEDITMLDPLGGLIDVERPMYLPMVLNSVYSRIIATGCKLVISSASDSLMLKRMAATVEIDRPGAEDFLAIMQNMIPADLSGFDVDRIARSYKRLSGYHIASAVRSLLQKGVTEPTVEDMLDALDKLLSRSNLVVDDIEAVTLDGLVGIDSAVRDLMRTIIIPMTQPELARELGLKPARGVLLHGEPGTGKTTIGRALARQMKGKFFIMDGSTPPGPKQDALLAAAEASSPSVFFIDDADVIFKNGENSGFARKLLTKLDGLETESSGNVCIIMTAMDVADMPPAIVRSGRVEVWIHMDLPDEDKRMKILEHYSASLPEDVRIYDEALLLQATEGFTPADLRGLVSDARGHIAYDRHKGRAVKTFEEYLLIAAEDIHQRKDILSAIGGKGAPAPRRRVPLRPPACTDGTCG